MDHIIYAKTDKGDFKVKNDDAYVIDTAESNGRFLSLAAVCDGIGGLKEGYTAASITVKELDSWFNETLPGLITASGMIDKDVLYTSLKKLIFKCDTLIRHYSAEKEIKSGTTLAALLILGNRCVTINVGDSRVYVIRNGKLHHLTTDQTLVQRAIDLGELTEEEALSDPRRSILLQCLGTGEQPVPTFAMASAKKDDIFFLCSDGFRHKISEQEFVEQLTLDSTRTSEDIKDTIDYLINTNRIRHEKDNITVIVARII